MTSYLDTSFLIKLYIFEAESQRVAEIVQQPGSELAISWLSEVEIASALHARAASGLAGGIALQAYKDFRQHITSGLYLLLPMHASVFELARSLGEQYGRIFHNRALDVLHVAAAVRNGAVAFGTFDDRQARLAEAVGLKLLR